MGSQDLRSFIAALRLRDKGLYVSTGGFTKEARYEAADRANNQVSLIDSDELVNLIINYYDNLMQKLDPFFLSGKFTGLNRLQEIACQTITI
jgi:restriction endonuclease Mrr